MSEQQKNDSHGGSPIRVGLVAAALLAVLSLPLILLNPGLLLQSSSAEELYHYPAVAKFSQELPTPDYSDYSSATAPGYHTVLAIPHRLGGGYSGARITGMLWSAALIGLLGAVAARRFGWWALLLVAPLLASNYLLFPAIWMMPDNAGWLGVIGVLLLCLCANGGTRALIAAGLVLVAPVSIRQVHIWAAAPIWLAAWIGREDQAPGIFGLFTDFSSRFGRALIALVCTLPGFAVLAWMYHIWGGLVTPTFQNEHEGINLATPGFILLQIAVISVFFTPMMLGELARAWKTRRAWLLGALVVGLVLGVAPISSYSIEDGRFGGWWSIVGKFPTFADRSPIFMLGSMGGAVAAVLWGAMLRRRDAWIVAGVMLAFVAAQTTNARSWQRYHEPMLLMLMLVLLARRSVELPAPRWIRPSLVLLTLMLAGITATQFRDVSDRAGADDPRVEKFRNSVDLTIPGG